MTAKWSHLPNARYIDQALAHLREHSEQWEAVWRTVGNDRQRNDRYTAEDAALLTIENAGRGAGRRAAWTASRDAAWRTAGVPLGAAKATLLALIAWDNSSKLLSLPIDQVEMLASLGHHPAVLLLPAVRVMSKEYRVQ